MRRLKVRQTCITLSVAGLALLQTFAPVLAQTVSFTPPTLSFSPAGPYSVPRDAGVGSLVASAVSEATAGDVAAEAARALDAPLDLVAVQVGVGQGQQDVKRRGRQGIQPGFWHVDA